MVPVKKLRSSYGFSIAELLVTTVILMVSMAVFSEITMLVTVASVKTTNKIEGIQAARIAINRISSDVRAARGVGDTYARGNARLTFPADENPLYGSIAGAPPAKGWPTAPWREMKVSSNTLILQIPVTVNNLESKLYGAPLLLKGTQLPNVDTVVYQVIPDPAKSNEYLLQVARFPGDYSNYSAKSTQAINPPVTLLKGIVGPRQTTGETYPAIFTYLSRTNYSSPFKKQTISLDADAACGVGIDLELKNTGLDSLHGDGRFPENFAIHSESFIRNYTTTSQY